MCIDDLNGDNHPDGIDNILTGRIAPYAINVASCVLSKNEESQTQCVLVAAEYQQLLAVGQAVMPDPLTELTVVSSLK